MAEVHQVHELREVPVPVERRRGGGLVPLLTFLFGAILIGVLVMMLFNVHWTISWPAGSVDIGLKQQTETVDTR